MLQSEMMATTQAKIRLLAGRIRCAIAEGISLARSLDVRGVGGSTIGLRLHGGKRRPHDVAIQRLGALDE